jgi:hypothetical protein
MEGKPSLAAALSTGATLQKNFWDQEPEGLKKVGERAQGGDFAQELFEIGKRRTPEEERGKTLKERSGVRHKV